MHSIVLILMCVLFTLHHDVSYKKRVVHGVNHILSLYYHLDHVPFLTPAFMLLHISL